MKPDIIAPDFTGDIDRELAHRAFYSTSHTPEQRGDRFIADFERQLRKDWEFLAQYVIDEEKRAILCVLFQSYRQGYAKRMSAFLTTQSTIASSFIVGPANFPVERMQKRQRWADARIEQAEDFRKRALKAIQEMLCPGIKPIMSGDPDAVERLTAEVARLERRQQRMLAVNKICRATKNQQDAARVAAVAATLIEHGYDAEKAPADARKLLHPPFAYYGEGYPSFTLRNNNANLRRQQKRLEALKRDKAKPDEQVEGDAARYEDAPAANRVRLYFPGKPDVQIRQRLKRGGFRWAPSIGAWQAYRNPGTVHLAREIAGITDPATVDQSPALAG